MRPILYYLKDFFSHLQFRLFLAIAGLMTVLIYVNYTFGLERHIVEIENRYFRFFAFFCLFTFVFGVSYLITVLLNKSKKDLGLSLILLIIFSTAAFAMKMSIRAVPEWLEAALSYPAFDYWKLTLHWPIKAVLVFALVWMIWRYMKFDPPLAGITLPPQGLRPYYILLCAATPLLVLASLSPSFQQMYPRVEAIYKLDNLAHRPWFYTLVYEIAYGIDFFTIELFFRGFLVLGFSRYLGKDVILPMAAFYCAIHFGKPLAECISSFFGGLMLGAIVYNTRSIWGGLVVHLGIAWGMEIIGGIIGGLVH